MKGNYVGQPELRIDARDKVTGDAPYPGDFTMKGQLFMKLRFAGRPHARVVAVDATAALDVPGVVAIFTSRDVPVNEYGLQYPDQPVLCGPGSAKEGTDVARFVGDQVAAVVAETEEAAEIARDLIEIAYEDLPVVSDPREALKPGAPRLHPPYPGLDIHPELVFDGNICSRHRIRRGDVEAVWNEAAVILESTYEIPGQEHIFLQPEAGFGYIDDEGRITIVTSTQWAHEDQHEIAHALDIPPEQVRVILPAIGGAFGGKEDMSVQIVLALAVWKLQRPVKIVWSRRESILGHHKRHRVFARARWAADAEGRLLAAETEVIADAGAYTYTTNKVLGNLVLTVNGPYRIPNIKTDVLGVYTNNIPGGAFRGFGAPQGNFIVESQMNKLAEALEIDPLEIRLRNLIRDGEPLPWGKPLPDSAVGLRDTLIAVGEALGWQETGAGWRAPEITPEPGDPPYLQRGKGIALGFKNVGFSFGYQENAWAGIELRGDTEIEEALVFAASSDVGQGTRTAIRQMAAEALDVPIERVCVAPADTTLTGSSGSCSASRMTFMIGNAIRGAAAEALVKWNNEERPAKADYTYLAPQTTQIDTETGYGHPNFSYGYVAVGADIAIDTELGIVHTRRLVCANDVGQAINPRLLEGQIEGGVVQALGWATTEHFIEKDGIPLTDTMSTYLIPTISDIPDEVKAIIIENPEPNGPWGARGMAEMPFIAVAAALHHAVRNTVGHWTNRFPFTSERILRTLKGK
ncbi:MAG: xanthine dehydrogenase family protein [Anaerolineae bacterium]|nr:xanthine dehydrogenase family protein [Anaerolineae bacterium]